MSQGKSLLIKTARYW